ncbi:hypothetical protein WJX73_002963 [Symbiochloris irregularis]|uniref:DNA repair protein Rad4 n=1 Tax=Symbiochloris irregularis TaxID=706552 RepID=A0AAW1P9V8_9CHLO
MPPKKGDNKAASKASDETPSRGRDKSAAAQTLAGVSSAGVDAFLDKRSDKEQKEEGTTKKPRQRFSKVDREVAVTTHRMHLMCLLARGQQFDVAASDPLVQAVASSLLPGDLSASLSASHNPNPAVLPVAMEWFRNAFNVLTEHSRDQQQDDSPAERLQACAATQSGSPEEAVALFAAVLRSQSLLVRIVRVLDGAKEASPGEDAEAVQGGTRKKAKASAAQSPPHQTVQDLTVESDTEAPEGPSASGEALAQEQRKLKGDLEFENQLSMALQASAAGVRADSQPAKEGSPQADSSIHDKAQQAFIARRHNRGAFKGDQGGGNRTQAQGAAWGRGRAVGDLGDVWVEVYCASAAGGRWVCVDPLRGIVDRPDDVESAAARMGPLAYVVAFAGGGAKDVTKRYVASFVTAEKHRDSAWFAQTLAPLRNLEGQAAAFMVIDREDRELHDKVAAERAGVPTTIDGFRNHERYVLHRFIGRYQALLPETGALGMHKGEAFYPRSALQDLHTADVWQRQGRQVREGEAPAKSVRKRGTKPPPTVNVPPAFEDDEEGDEETPASPKGPETHLYGLWQTQGWQAPVAMDGIVPKNDRGNVHVPPFASALPQGTVHIRKPRLGPVCKQLGLDYAPAMLGFEIRAGRSVPVIEGIVVCADVEQLVLDAYEAAEQDRIERAEARAAAEAATTWRQLLNAVLARMRVQRDHATPTWERPNYHASPNFKKAAAASKRQGIHVYVPYG